MPTTEIARPHSPRGCRTGAFALWFLGIGFVNGASGNPCAFQLSDPAGVDLDACRPAPLGGAQRAAVLAGLPKESDVVGLDRASRRKTRALERVLRLHGRSGIYVVKVIDVAQAFVGLHERAALLISERALELLDEQELEALVAHEIGHEYYWSAYHAAHTAGDAARLRQIELASDGIAVETLVRLGVPPERLTSALEKVCRYNRERFGAARNESEYPSLEARRDLVARATSGTVRRIAFETDRYVVHAEIAFLPAYRGRRLAFSRPGEGSAGTGFTRAGKESPAPECFVGALAVVTYTVRLPDGRPARQFRLRERVTLIDQHSSLLPWRPLERTVSSVAGVATDIQLFGYDEEGMDPAARRLGRENSSQAWRLYRQELYIDDQTAAVAVLEWRHTIRSIELVGSHANPGPDLPQVSPDIVVVEARPPGALRR
jgi:acetolactate synthase regulatory subunit